MVNLDFYKNGKIYKIVCNKTGLIYVGSTCKKLCQRLAGHREKYRAYLKGMYTYVTSFKILENDDYDIILLELFPCDSKEQLTARERFYIESMQCVNKIVPTRTLEEYKIQFGEDIRQKKQEFYELNKESILEKAKQNYIDNREIKLEKQKEYSKLNADKIKEYKKEYVLNNKEKIKQGREEFYKNNKDKINSERSIIFNCECGTACTLSHKARHNKSLKHIDYINTLTTTNI